MGEINTTNLRDKGQKVIIDKISKAAKELSFPNDKMAFIEQMISLSRLLMSYDLHISTAFRTIDEKAQDPTYFVATYFDTKDIQQALQVHRMVRLLARYILVYDRYFETRKNRYAILARKVRKSINKIFENEIDNHHLKYSIDFSLKQFWPFWKFEQILKSRIIEGNTFSYNEIRNFNLFKSSDASLIYARVLDAKLPSFSENVSLVLHYNQALLDLIDDWEDIEEDIQEDMPNAFVMAAIDNVPYKVIKKYNVTKQRNAILNSLESLKSPIIRLVDEYHTSIRNISIPSNLVFIKLVSDHHADTLRKAISL
ncbi:MAG: hypothetical protein QOA17_07785 [Nitrososphaeraceae archaeon]|nr:hypothetical protein [Nitrososphaeraceae archaeon]MDW0178511.1 hypothetical protein [Nitrososphaeraceae archaeon]MDW0212344.1 hypothetical protein [Nitrososphaeraceae archaeon]MDW0232466.1 hypothetical protein [Nitrososphaeraceae archaeon]MDW0240379.1 hypothetical protein [Nitrososphaeraceae archaeon]